MILIIREYLSMLRESEELDALIPDLLLSMNIQPTSKPQRGVRQYGVDLAAVGIDPVDNIEKLFLFVIKQKDIDRNAWDSGPQSVRPTLNDIFDVYLQVMVDEHQRSLPKKIILCTNGSMKQDVLVNWTNYLNQHRQPGQIEFEFWSGENLASLVNQYLLDEFLFPDSVQKHMRKALVFLDLVEYDLSHFYDLIDEVLFDTALTTNNKKIKALRCLHLCINLLFYWTKESGNLKHAVHSAERLILRLWDWVRQTGQFENGSIFEEFYKINSTRMQINLQYLQKIGPHCLVRDGLSGYGSEEIEYPLRTFEQIGIIANIGLDYMFANESLAAENTNNFLVNQANKARYYLESIIANNKSSNVLLFDSHINEVCLALLLLHKTNRHQTMVKWINEIFLYIVRGYQQRNRFPLLSDSYDDLVDLELNNTELKLSSSTLLPMLLEWSAVLDLKEFYNKARLVLNEVFCELNLQIWFPDDTTEDWLYSKNALRESGAMLNSIELPEDFAEYKAQILHELDHEENPQNFSFMSNKFPIIGAIVFRHFRTPIFPFYWRQSINRKNEESNRA